MTSRGGAFLGLVCKFIEPSCLSRGVQILDTLCSTLACVTSEYRVTLTLRQRYTLRHGQDIVICSIDSPAHLGTQSQ